MNIFLCFDRWSTMCNVVYTSQLDAIAFSLILDTIFIFLSWFHVPLQSEIRPMPTVYVILFTNLTSKWYTRCMRTSNGDEELALFVFVSSLSLFSFIQWSIYKFLFRLVGCSIALLVLALTCLLACWLGCVIQCKRFALQFNYYAQFWCTSKCFNWKFKKLSKPIEISGAALHFGFVLGNDHSFSCEMIPKWTFQTH